MKLSKLPLLLIVFTLCYSCGNDNAKTKDTKSNTKKEAKLTFILDDLLIYDSHEEVAKAGFRVIKSTVGKQKSYTEKEIVITEYNSYINSPDGARVKWIWTDETRTKLKGVNVEIGKGKTSTQWKTKNGYTPNTLYNDWITTNGKPVLIGEFGYNTAPIDWNGGALANSDVRITIINSTGVKPGFFLKFKGEPVPSDNTFAKRYTFNTHSMTLLKK